MNKRLKYTLRIENILHQKLNFMADFNGRSKNKEIETAIKRYIKDFENLHGAIDFDENLED